MKRFFSLILLTILLVSCVDALSLNDIVDKGVIRVGVRDGKAPFSNIKNGAYEGFEIEFANRIAESIFKDKKGTLQFITLQTSDRVNALKNDNVDLVISTMTITDERLKEIDFSMPYFSVDLGILTRKEDKIRKISEFRSKKLLVEEGSTGKDYFIKKGFNTIPCKSSNECYGMLKAKEGDGFATDNLIVMAYPIVDRDVEVNIKNVGSVEFLAVGVQKGNKELLDVVNSALIKLSKEGFFQHAFDDEINPFYKGTIEDKYFLLDGIYKIFG